MAKHTWDVTVGGEAHVVEYSINWVTAAGALEHLDMELVDYLPVYRSPAGTGGGWGFARWQ